VDQTLKKEGPNFILWAFILVSICIHALLFYHFNGMHPRENETYTEIELGNAAPPPARTIPRPPSQPQVPAPNPADISPEIPAEIPEHPYADTLIPAPKPPREYSPEVPPPVPDLDADPQLPIAEWQAVKPPESADVGSQAEYFTRVRFAIEAEKQYPAAARKRRLEGQVLVRFTIGADGSLSGLALVEGSRYDTLDQAALAAVRAAAPFPSPPTELFDGALELTVPMMFEIID